MNHDIGSLIAIVGLIGWICSMIYFIFGAFPARGVFDPVRARMRGICVGVFFAIWVGGLLCA